MKSKLPERNCDVCRKSGMEKLSPFLWQCRNPECNAFYHAAIRKCIVMRNSVDPKYLEWMREIKNRKSFQLKWKDGKPHGYPSQIDIILDMKAMFSELLPCAGVAKFVNSQYREYWRHHAWLEDINGNVIDPAQLESESVSEYRCYTNRHFLYFSCIVCGKLIAHDHDMRKILKRGKETIGTTDIFCSDACKKKYVNFIDSIDSTQNL